MLLLHQTEGVILPLFKTLSAVCSFGVLISQRRCWNEKRYKQEQAKDIDEKEQLPFEEGLNRQRGDCRGEGFMKSGGG